MLIQEINDFVTYHFGNWGILIQALATYGAFVTFSITLIISLITLIEDRKKRDIEFKFLYEQTEIQRDNLEATKTLNKLYLELIRSKEGDSEQQKILDKIIAVEKEKRRRAIMPEFVIEYQGGLQTVWLKNIGEQARKIKVFLEIEDRNLKRINTYSPNTHIEKDGVLKIDLSEIPDNFKLFIHFEDMEAIMKYSQYIYLEKRKFKISNVSWLYIEE